MNSEVLGREELVKDNDKKPEKLLFSALKHQGYTAGETFVDNTYALRYTINIHRMHRGFLVQIGCEKFIFHERELHFMGTFLANYTRDYRGVRAIVQANAGNYPSYMENLEEFVMGSHEKTCFQRFESLHVKLGNFGYCIQAVDKQCGRISEWFFSNVEELSDTLYKLITGELGKEILSTKVPKPEKQHMPDDEVTCESDCVGTCKLNCNEKAKNNYASSAY